VIGVVLAFVLRRRDVTPRVRYDWEGRDDVVDLDPLDEEARPARMPEPGTPLH
jgi:hypothetical protein